MKIQSVLVLLIAIWSFNADATTKVPKPQLIDLKDRFTNAAMKIIALDGLVQLKLNANISSIVVNEATSLPTVPNNNVQMQVTVKYSCKKKPCKKDQVCSFGFTFPNIKPVIFASSCNPVGLLGANKYYCGGCTICCYTFCCDPIVP